MNIRTDRLDSLDWSLIQAFIAVASDGSLSQAARTLGVSQPTLGRQVKSMEERLGIALFFRQPKGLRLTAEGKALLPHATAMAEAASRFATRAAGHDMSVSGTVRITASEFTSLYMLPQILAQMRRTHPDIEIELNPTDISENLLFREADIAVRMYRPTQLEMVTKKLGMLRLGFWATQEYLDRKGVPRSVEDLFDHDLLGYDRLDRFIRVANQMGWPLKRSDFCFRCDTQNVHCEMIRNGAGVGVMEVNLAQMHPELVQVLPDFPVPGLEVWLTTHEALRHTPRVETVWRALEAGLTPWLTHDAAVPVMP
ncbi:LysR family transcriptional regulator [Litoreibacter ponti]|uniref:LysR family transcriptional regulator n=1 Tax=Litoreibacter ponti TaxID=1510457 RepID=A0A2T6BPK0_9RHOB|nr:LysR family transcriptional regulator [Litoreibacter ponti]PTX58001.1 LysR family transcriptional regulator [Litoreibacter ponti]